MTNKKFLYINDEPAIKKLPEEPWMGEEGLILFKELANKAQYYLEFGSGGSTIYMIKNSKAKKIISVDSDKDWVKKINESLNESQKNRLHIEHCNIGQVGSWGVPRNNSHIDSYWRYMVTPWGYATKISIKPDLILIDGRFRVACFLYSLLASEIGTTILFDDYADRPEYFVVEQFCKLSSKAGRMGVFKSSKDYSTTEICQAIAQYSVQPD